MLRDLLEGQVCRACARDLSQSFLTRVTLGIEKADRLLFPVLCVCGEITVIGGEIIERQIDREQKAVR